MPNVHCSDANPVAHTVNDNVYDRQAALDRAGGDPGTAMRFLDMLLDLLAQTEYSLSQALDHDDLIDLKEQAHRLAGAAPYCGATALQEAAKRLETRAREGERDLNTALTRDLIDQIARFRMVTSVKQC